MTHLHAPFRGLLSSEQVPFDVVSVGAALMDHLVHVPPEVLERFDLERGTMSLADSSTVAAVRAATVEERRISGGAEANTAVGVASLGGKSAFVGAVANDEIGNQYATDLSDAGVVPVLDRITSDDVETGSSLVLVTPDAERTMLTALGAAPLLDHRRIDDDLLDAAKVVYFSAYLLDYPAADDLVARIMRGSKATGTTVAFSMADPLSVERHHDQIEELLKEGLDVVFANAAEAAAATGIDDPQAALEALASRVGAVFVTRGPDGAVAAAGDRRASTAAYPVDAVVDATGAGDLFAAGALGGFTRGLELQRCVELGARCAAEVIGHLGARPNTSLEALCRSDGLLA